MTPIDKNAIINAFIKVVQLIASVKSEIKENLNQLNQQQDNYITKEKLEEILSNKVILPTPQKANQVLKTKEENSKIVVYWTDITDTSPTKDTEDTVTKTEEESVSSPDSEGSKESDGQEEGSSDTETASG